MMTGRAESLISTKRPEVYPNWDEPESDEEEVPSDVFFGMKVDVKVESIDFLKNFFRRRVAGCLWPT